MGSEIRALTGIRGIAAMWVFFFHFGPAISKLLPGFAVFEPLYSIGGVGVDLFFVLSGFIISYVYFPLLEAGTFSMREYVIKRFARIYPNHFVTLMLLLGLVLGAHAMGMPVMGTYSVRGFFEHLFMLQAFPFAEKANWNYPAWSISAEFFGYVVIFPLGVWLLRRIGLHRQGLWLAVLLAVTYALLMQFGLEHWDNIVRISLEFLSGMFLFHGLRSLPEWKGRLGRTLPWVIAIGVVAAYLVPNAREVTALCIVLCPLVIGGLSGDCGWVCRLLGWSPVRYLGLISYALYMSHALVQKVLKVALPVENYADAGLWLRGGVVALHIVAPIVVAAALYHLCEEPGRRWLQRTASGR